MSMIDNIRRELEMSQTKLNTYARLTFPELEALLEFHDAVETWIEGENIFPSASPELIAARKKLES